jgi:hypothetical protein
LKRLHVCSRLPGSSAAVWPGVDTEEGRRASTGSHYGLVLGGSISDVRNDHRRLRCDKE